QNVTADAVLKDCATFNPVTLGTPNTRAARPYAETETPARLCAAAKKVECATEEAPMTLGTTAPSDTSSAAPRTRPFTGAEYLESLRDGREIWIYGERVKDVTTHPAFRNTVRMIARLYDALHDPAHKAILTSETDTGSGGYTHKFYRPSRNVEEMVAARDAIAEWARITYGWIGRSPDYKAAFLATLGANSAFYEPFEANAKAWYKKVQEE